MGLYVCLSALPPATPTYFTAAVFPLQRA